jgi:ABC-2 type transport system permease protein
MTALRTEWSKLRSLRSTTWTLLAMAGLTIALGVVSCSTAHTEGAGPGDIDDAVVISLAGVYLGQIAAVAFGVIAISSEFTTGTIRATFAANPRRRVVLAAKTATVGALVLDTAAVATIAAFCLGQPILHGNGYVEANGYHTASLGDATALRTVAMAAAYLVMLSVLSLGVAAMVRSTAAAISIVLGLLFVPFVVGSLLPESLSYTVEKASPMAGIAAQEAGAPIGPWAGIGATAAWAVAALAVALWLIARRDT